MADHVYKQIEITGSSTTGSDDAVRNAITKAAKTVDHLAWFHVVDTRGHIDADRVRHWQVTIKIGFRLED